MTAPEISVGIFTRPEADFTLHGLFQTPAGEIVSGSHKVSASGDKVVWKGGEWDELLLIPSSLDGDSFELQGVTIGINFHWQRKEKQRFRGTLRIIARDGEVTVINIVPIEEYITSVISSEMKASSSMSLLRAHAVISRSWVLARLMGQKAGDRSEMRDDADEIVRWWDNEEHSLFDVCADDHCQRYQGISRIQDSAFYAAADTRGIVLTTDGGTRICDARFSKCCGGVFEIFSTCWADEDERHTYLKPRRDWTDPTAFPNLTIEKNAAEWIEGYPWAFCRTTNKMILNQVLNSYDLSKNDIYRWTVTYTREELTNLVRVNLGRDLGTIQSLEPLARGMSGRIYRLRINGSKGSIVIGKELMIRRVLSDTHLKSSAFTVHVEGDTFTLRGAGWGHGVGLCQIGAAMMGETGYSWEEILRRYYPGAELTKLY